MSYSCHWCPFVVSVCGTNNQQKIQLWWLTITQIFQLSNSMSIVLYCPRMLSADPNKSILSLHEILWEFLCMNCQYGKYIQKFPQIHDDWQELIAGPFLESPLGCPTLLQIHQLHAFTVRARTRYFPLDINNSSLSLPAITSIYMYMCVCVPLTGVVFLLSCCNNGNGVHWIGSIGQLQTDRSLAFPESTTPSAKLQLLRSQPYWELPDMHRSLLKLT